MVMIDFCLRNKRSFITSVLLYNWLKNKLLFGSSVNTIMISGMMGTFSLNLI